MTEAIDQMPAPAVGVVDQRFMRPVAGVAQASFAWTVGSGGPRRPEEETGQRGAVGRFRQRVRRHCVLFAQLVVLLGVAEQAGVVVCHGAHCFGADGRQLHFIGVGVVGVGTQFGLHQGVNVGFGAGFELGVVLVEVLAGEQVLQRDCFAVQPVGRPVRCQVGAVAPDGTQLLAAGRQPGALAVFDLVRRVQHRARVVDDLRYWRRFQVNFAAHPAQYRKR